MHNSRHIRVLLALSVALVSQCTKNPLGPDTEAEAVDIPWSMIEGRIAFSRVYGSTPPGETYLLLIDGNLQEFSILAKSSRAIFFETLSWTPDGTRISSSGDAPGSTLNVIYDIDADGSNLTPLYAINGDQRFPSWSLDGDLAYHAVNTDCAFCIYVNGTPFFGAARCEFSRPAWSPDGSHLVISVQDSTSQGALYRIAISGGEPQPLLQNATAYNREIYLNPLYSPDGSMLAYERWVADNPEEQEIWVLEASGANPRQLTSGNRDFYPAWSPDGQQIAFSRSGKGLFLVDVATLEVTQVTKIESRWATWTP